MYFDSHAHYDDEKFDIDRNELLNGIKERGVSYVVNVAADMSSAHESIKLAEEYDFIYASVGVHPHEVESMNQSDIDRLRKLSNHPKVVAVGEIGLDYYYDFSPRDIQKEWFIKQLQLAKQVNLPVIIHSRDACQETFDIISKSGVEKGVIHCFSGSAEMAKEYVKRNFYIGVGGAVTFKNAKKIVEVVETIPLTSIVIETDAPYLTPVPYRGKRNESSYLGYVVEEIAKIKGVTVEEVSQITMSNAQRLFDIKESTY